MPHLLLSASPAEHLSPGGPHEPVAATYHNPVAAASPDLTEPSRMIPLLPGCQMPLDSSDIKFASSPSHRLP